MAEGVMNRNAPHDLKLPPGSILSADLPLPRSEIVQAMRDVLRVSLAFLFVSITAAGFAAGGFILLFVRIE